MAPSSAVAAFLQKSGKDVEKTALLLLQKRELAFVSSAEETFDAQSTSQLVQLPRFARACAPPRAAPPARLASAASPACFAALHELHTHRRGVFSRTVSQSAVCTRSSA